MNTSTARAGLLQDLERNCTITSATGTASAGARLRTFITLRYQAALLLRSAQAVGRRVSALGGLLKQWNQFVTGADIAWEARIGPALVLFHPNGVVIGPEVVIGRDCVIQQGVTLGGDGVSHVGPARSPVLGDRVTIGAGARVIGAVAMLDDCVVGANAVVTKSAPAPGMVAVGIPAVWRERATAAPSVADSPRSQAL